MPVAVELNGLLPGRGPGRGGPGVPDAGRAGAPPGRGVPPGPDRGAAGLGPGVPPPGALVPDPGALVPAGLVPEAAAAGASGRPCGNGTGGRVGLGAWPGGPPAAASGAGLAAGPGTGPGAGRGPVGAGGTGRALPFVAAWPSCPSRAATASAPVGAAAAGAAGAAAAGADAGALGADAAGCAGRASPRPPPRACLGCWVANASLSLRTTGASIVEDADRTNSPISWSLAITALLSTPNSFASSYTRTFATALPLLGPARPDQSAGRRSLCSVRRQPLLFIAACSSVAHRNLSLLSRGRVALPLALFPPSPCLSRYPRSSVQPRPAGRCPAANCPAAGCPVATGQDTRQACRFQAVPAVAVPARMPAGAALPRSIPGWGAGTRPGRALAPAGRERSRSRLPPGEASRTWPHGICIRHRSGSLARAGQAADTA
jgi:hypothetical protein